MEAFVSEAEALFITTARITKKKSDKIKSHVVDLEISQMDADSLQSKGILHSHSQENVSRVMH